MKNVHKIIGLAVAMAASAQVGSVLAATSQNAGGCHATWPYYIDYLRHATTGTVNESTVYGVDVTCPFSNDHPIGTPQFDVFVFDGHTSSGVTCNGVILGANGFPVGATPQSTSVGTGNQWLTFSLPAPDTWQNSYAVSCYLPAKNYGYSTVLTMRLY
jgi:hypothetical protein